MGELLGRYELVQKLATGGMADIFLARQWGDGGFARTAIVKRLHDHLTEQHTLLSDFRNEAHLLCSLIHPSIPHIYDFRHEEGCWYLAMEFLKGPTLGAAFRVERARDGNTPWQIGVAIALELLEVLCYVHERLDDGDGTALGIIHGDLSPENVVLGRDGGVKLLDFGIAGDTVHRERQRPHASGIRGTNGYIAPEAIDHQQPVDARADLFVIAILIYELTTCTRLYPGDGLAFMNALREQTPAPPSDRVADYPEDLERILLRMLSPLVTDRPASAREVYAELGQLAANHGIDTGPHIVAAYAEQILPATDDLHLPNIDCPTELQAIHIATIPPPPAGHWEEPGSELTDEEHQDLVGDLDLFSPESVLEEQANSDLSGIMDDLEAESDMAIDVQVDELSAPLTAIKTLRDREDSTLQMATGTDGKADGGGDESDDGFYIYVADEE